MLPRPEKMRVLFALRNTPVDIIFNTCVQPSKARYYYWAKMSVRVRYFGVLV